ncbi:MAG: flagellar motor protein MotB [Rhodobacter sp.]|nr:flagellar motor protein MotB [Rhodobacter sp.]
MSANDLAPIIIKRKKIIAGGGHHGGAWKVAYADFVTAMMAFFLLMWLLNATTEVQRKGIADYFNPTIPINRISGGGDGAFGGSDIFSEDNLARTGNGATQRNPAEKNMARGDSGVTDADAEASETAEEKVVLDSIDNMLTAKSGESMVSNDMARHIVTQITDEGLIVEIFDLPGEPLFALGTDEPTAVMRDLAAMMTEVFALVSNGVAVNGFTRARSIVETDNPVWTLSSDRANRVRQLLGDGGLPDGRVQRVSGFADRKPVAQNPMAPRNNRIELILLRDNL